MKRIRIIRWWVVSLMLGTRTSITGKTSHLFGKVVDTPQAIRRPHVKTLRRGSLLAAIALFVAIMAFVNFPGSNYIAEAATGTQPVPGTITDPASKNCSGNGICTYACPSGYQSIPGANNRSCCPNNSTYNTTTKLCESSSSSGGGGNNNNSGGGNNSGAPQPPTCETNGNALAWILCPVYDMMSNMANEIFNNVVEPFLYTSPISTNAKDPSFKTWSSFRIYGDIFLVMALLITVIAQSIGGGLIDAYTVKKILPRVLITAILINL